MECEICRTIERLGLDPSAHDLWVCTNHRQAPARHSFGSRVKELGVKAAMLQWVVSDYVLAGGRQLLNAGLHSLISCREHYITLGL